MITQKYLSSRDFNGFPLMDAGLTRAELEPLLRELLESEQISLSVGSPHPNPHIKALRPAPTAEQLSALGATEDLAHVTAYPEKAHLRTVVDVDAYADRPFTLRLALGEVQLTPLFFELSVLEIYRNDPRYYYTTDDISGSISVTDKVFESSQMRESDQVVLQTFGFGYDEDLHRAVCVFLRYLSDLSPEHQQIWAARELGSGYRLHPAYYTSSILGDFYDGASIFEAFLAELEQIQKMCKAAGLPPLVHSSFQENKPANFTFLIRPTLKELQDFHSTLDKLMSGNLGRDFFAEFLPSLETEERRADGRIVVKPKGTIQLLEEWLQGFRTDDRSDIEEMSKTFREVRDLRPCRRRQPLRPRLLRGAARAGQSRVQRRPANAPGPCQPSSPRRLPRRAGLALRRQGLRLLSRCFARGPGVTCWRPSARRRSRAQVTHLVARGRRCRQVPFRTRDRRRGPTGRAGR